MIEKTNRPKKFLDVIAFLALVFVFLSIVHFLFHFWPLGAVIVGRQEGSSDRVMQLD